MDKVKYAPLVKIGRKGCFVVVYEPHDYKNVIPISRDKEKLERRYRSGNTPFDVFDITPLIEAGIIPKDKILDLDSL